MKIKVRREIKRNAGGGEPSIADKLREKLKARTKPGPAAAPAGTVSNEERKKKLRDAVAARTANIVHKVQEQSARDVLEFLDGMELTDRSGVPEAYRNAEHRGVIQMRSPTDPLYARMPEEVRAWRNADSDHYMAQWIRGEIKNDWAAMAMADDKLDEMFGLEKRDLGRTAMDEGTAGASGAISSGTIGAWIPRPLEAVVQITRDAISKLRALGAPVMPMTAQQHTIPTAGAMTAAMVAEGATAADGSPAGASVALLARKMQATALVSVEAYDDAAINLVNTIATRGGGAMAALENTEWFELGTGTAPHMVKLSGTATTTATAATMCYTDFLTMYYALPEEYIDGSIWLIAADLLTKASTVRDGQGRPFFQGLQERPAPLGQIIGRGPMPVGDLFGRPVYRAPWSNGTVWFGDLSAAFQIGQRAGIALQSSEHIKFDTDQIMFKLTQRIGSQNVDTIGALTMGSITAITSL